MFQKTQACPAAGPLQEVRKRAGRFFSASIYLILLCLLAGLLCVRAAAEEFPPQAASPEPYGAFQRGAFRGPQSIPGEPELLSDLEQELYDRLLKGMRERTQDAIPLADLQLPNDGLLWEIFYRVLDDHPEFFYIDYYDIWYHQHVLSHLKLIYYDFSYYGFSGIDGAVSAFDAAVEEALSASVEPGMTDLEKALALHNYLVGHCAYNWDVAAALQISYEAYVELWMNTPNKQFSTAFGALVNGDPVCQGYSLAYKLLLSRVGIDSILVGSETMHHVWNAVRLDGAWYHTDVTWDDTAPNREGFCRYGNFLISDAALEETGHSGWEQLVDCTDTAYESGWIFNGGNHPICRREGRYFYTQNNGNQMIRLLTSPGLEAEGGTVIRDNLNGYFHQGAVWVDGYLYYATYASDGDYRLLRCGLDTGKISQIGAFRFEKTPAPDGTYGENRDSIGLRRSGDRIEVVSATRRTAVDSFPIPPDLSGWESQTAESVELAGLAEDGATVGILWGGYSPWTEDLTLLAAFCRDGKMRAVRTCRIPAAVTWARTPDLKLARIDSSSLPAYDEVRLMLIHPEGSQPLCPAKQELRTRNGPGK